MNCRHCQSWDEEEAKEKGYKGLHCKASIFEQVDASCLMKHQIVISSLFLKALEIRDLEKRHREEMHIRIDKLLRKLEKRINKEEWAR